MKNTFSLIAVILLSVPAFAAGWNPPTFQGIRTATGFVGSAEISIGFEDYNVIEGVTNWCDIYFPIIASEVLIGPNDGETRPLYVRFDTNDTHLTQYAGWYSYSTTNDFSISPTTIPLSAGTMWGIDKKLKRIFITGPCGYRLMLIQR